MKYYKNEKLILINKLVGIVRNSNAIKKISLEINDHQRLKNIKSNWKSSFQKRITWTSWWKCYYYIIKQSEKILIRIRGIR